MNNVKSRKYGIIYLIKNKINGKVYVGKTKFDFNKRYDHKGVGIERVFGFYEGLRKANRPYNVHLYNSILKYGLENFEVEEEFFVAKTKEQLNKKEIYFIKKFKSNDIKYGYNKTGGGDGGQDKLHYEEWLRRKKVLAERRNKKVNKIYEDSLVYLEKNLSISEISRITGCSQALIRIAKQRYLGKQFICVNCGMEDIKFKERSSQKYCKTCSKKKAEVWRKKSYKNRQKTTCPKK